MNISAPDPIALTPTCPHANARPELVHHDNGNGTFSTDFAMVCTDCGKRATILLKAGPTNQAVLPWTWHPVAPAVRVVSGSKKSEPRQPAASTVLLKEFRAAGGVVPETIHKGLVRTLASVKDDERLLMLGAAGGIIPFAVDRGGAEHVVVTDEPLTVSLARTTVQPTSWEPPYGQMWDGIIVAGELMPDWRERLPTLLKPDGDCWLIGKARQYSGELSAAWGYEPLTAARGTPAEYLFFHSDMRPLLPGGPGTYLHDQIAAMGMPECQACRNLAHRMNAWCVSGCRERLEEIVAEMLPRARAWWQHTDTRTKFAAWWQSSGKLWSAFQGATAVATGDLDDMLRDVVRRQVTLAIAAAT
ncbi:MAG: hypothetical protein IPM64_17945 [Phycisphaerales bacterium]|nr:hypothetical protein [Phycisphaerales bacterium]